MTFGHKATSRHVFAMSFFHYISIKAPRIRSILAAKISTLQRLDASIISERVLFA